MIDILHSFKVESFGSVPDEVNIYGTLFWRNASGELHRIGGPAIEHADGTKSWWEYGEYIRSKSPNG